MSSIQIAGLGLTTIDILMRLEHLPTWTSFHRMRELRMDGGGPVGTGIVAAARLGARVGYIGTRGSDEAAQLKMSFLTRDNVDISRVVCRPGPEAQIILCYVHEVTGERMFAGADTLSEVLLRPEELDREYITSAEYLHLDGFHQEAAIQAARWMHEAGKKVMLDAGKSDGSVSDGMRELVKLTDVLICGSGFGAALTGKQDLWQAGEAMQAIGPQIVVQTEGEDGSYTLTANDRFHTPAFPVQVVDTTGAGDVFHGGYMYALLQGWDLRKAAVFSTAVSALKCTRLGGRVGIPQLDEVNAFLKERGYDFE